MPAPLLDALDVTEPASVAEFQGWARAVIADIRGASANGLSSGQRSISRSAASAIIRW